MSQDIVNEVYFLAYSVIMGIAITFVYDFILIGRKIIRHNLFFISLEDFLFWAACAVAVFYMLYKENNGILRWFAVFGAALGMLLYKKIIGTRFVKLISVLIQKEIHIISKILGFIFRPLGWLAKKAMGFCRCLSGRAKKTGRYMKKLSTVKKRHNRFGMFLVTTVVVMMLVVVAIKSIELQQKLETYQAKELLLQEQIEAEQERTKEIEEYEKYTQTKKYIEEVAKDKLGLVHEGEIIFKEGN